MKRYSNINNVVLSRLHVGQWNKSDDSNISKTKCSYLMFVKDDTKTHLGKDNIFKKWFWENGMSTNRNIKVFLYPPEQKYIPTRFIMSRCTVKILIYIHVNVLSTTLIKCFVLFQVEAITKMYKLFKCKE